MDCGLVEQQLCEDLGWICSTSNKTGKKKKNKTAVSLTVFNK